MTAAARPAPVRVNLGHGPYVDGTWLSPAERRALQRWQAAVDAWPHTRAALAAELGVSRVTLGTFLALRHARRPLQLLTAYAGLLARTGTAGGTPAPTAAELALLWPEARAAALTVHGRR